MVGNSCSEKQPAAQALFQTVESTASQRPLGLDHGHFWVSETMRPQSETCWEVQVLPIFDSCHLSRQAEAAREEVLVSASWMLEINNSQGAVYAAQVAVRLPSSTASLAGPGCAELQDCPGLPQWLS